MDCTPDSDQDEDATAKGHAVTMEKTVPANTREYRDLQVHLCAESQLLITPVHEAKTSAIQSLPRTHLELGELFPLSIIDDP